MITEDQYREAEIEHCIRQARWLIDRDLVSGRCREVLEAMIIALRCEDWDKIAELGAEALANIPTAVAEFKAAVENERLAEN